MSSPLNESHGRRRLLVGLMKLLVFIGFVFLCIPFISSFSIGEIDEKASNKTRWVIEASVAELELATIKRLSWRGGVVWVYSRTEKEIQSLGQTNHFLRDAQSIHSDQPDLLQTAFRSADKRYFVFIPTENKRGCQVRLNRESEKALLSEPCFNARYDSAGRIFDNSGHKEQHNLSVPQHTVENGILKIGIWSPKI